MLKNFMAQCVYMSNAVSNFIPGCKTSYMCTWTYIRIHASIAHGSILVWQFVNLLLHSASIHKYALQRFQVNYIWIQVLQKLHFDVSNQHLFTVIISGWSRTSGMVIALDVETQILPVVLSWLDGKQLRKLAECVSLMESFAGPNGWHFLSHPNKELVPKHSSRRDSQQHVSQTNILRDKQVIGPSSNLSRLAHIRTGFKTASARN